ncbi:MAG TPA: hypothetical protein DIC33_04060 [Kandleria vitulina]|uniref:hypothetical protein n=1 Tax=Kandleria vitulina TaxID=1630 RepID=UPI000E90C0A8|nr:hypothetical protein [Kandleria vitulina]HBG67681.1 hypothetical protein [Kandleria vitulina]HCY53253.1 hypothetical protein [Kandleria vitulina]
MPFKIDIQTNIDEKNLDIETCKNLIRSLEETYKNTRTEIYSHFLGMKSMRLALMLAATSLFFYFMTTMPFFLYGAFGSVLLIMIASLLLAETTSKIIRKQVKMKIEQFRETLDRLQRMKELKKS